MKTAKQRGFTLLEIIVSLAIFATLSLAATLLMQGSLRSGEHTRQASDRLAVLQRTVALLEQDFSHALARKTIGQPAVNRDSEFEISYSTADNNASARLIRGNKINPGLRFSRSQLEWVKWSVEDHHLIRESWPFGYDSEVKKRRETVLENVTTLQLKAWDKTGWHQTWASKDATPDAINIVIESPLFGVLERTLLMSRDL